ncbi:glycerophosphodiester phosphodiesterase family protein [Macrococcoides canis]|uniref:glycerophosphodiester phosphodiesterase family protein n=1 Tax=Macrococcoides canis TaxID=1855823 RepID=UPI0022B91BFA|nr:glycerophosphodiester phosphodiesterase family protein [Macrococcus canis]WBF53994.1 glycerophosphodiester phosphodiesterase [Macrococcus canis]
MIKKLLVTSATTLLCSTILLSDFSTAYAKQNIAHRGASGTTPENTLEAFNRARFLGADTLELDIQLTKDNRLVVMHDKTLDRTTNGSGYIKNYTLKQIHQLNAGSWYVNKVPNLTQHQINRFNSQKVPHLDYVFYRYKNSMKYLIETEKSGTWTPYMETELVNAMRKYGMLTTDNLRNKRVVVQSYSPASLKRIKALDSRISTRLLCGTGVLNKMTYTQLKEVRKYADSVTTSYKDLSPQKVDMLRQLGMGTYVFTVNDYNNLRRVNNTNVMGIITDYPDRYRYILNQ